jgi:hypothetical protein
LAGSTGLTSTNCFYHPRHFGGVFVLLAEFPNPVEINYNWEFGDEVE